MTRSPTPCDAPRRPPHGTDARIDDPDVALVHAEAKWNAKLGTGKGATHGTRDDQVILRRDALRALDDKTPGRPLVVLCVGNRPIDTSSYNEQARKARPVRIVSVSWDDLAACTAHPRCGDFSRYLSWKREVATIPPAHN